MFGAARMRPRRRPLSRLLVVAAVLLPTMSFVTVAREASAADDPTASACEKSGPQGLSCHNPSQFGRAWNPSANALAPAGFERTVVVDQTEGLTSQVVNVSWNNFTPSTDRPGTVPPAYFTDGFTYYGVQILECRTAAPTSFDQCFNTLDSNVVSSVTSAATTQSVQFGVLSKEDEPSLGCDADTPCSLVVLPWSGGLRTTLGGNPANCLDHSADTLPGVSTAQTGLFDINLCAWDSRIAVPLHFAPTPSDCPTADNQITFQGSPVTARAIGSWRTALCSGSSHLTVGYTDVGEYLARNNADNGAIDIGLTTQPDPSPAKPYVYAPIANTALAVSYYVDGSDGRPITDLKLNASLLAKMLTQSYAVLQSTKSDPPYDCVNGSLLCAEEVAGNPKSLFVDPGFQRLNPRFPKPSQGFPSRGAYFPTVVFGDSDATYRMTEWIAKDGSASAFLAGVPVDSTKLNTAYATDKVGTLYPTSAFNAQDAGASREVSAADAPCAAGSMTGVCVLGGMQYTWNPVNGLKNVAKTLLAGKDSGRTFEPSCPVSVAVCDQHPADPPAGQGLRVAFAVTSLADAKAYQFPVAALETTSGTYVLPTVDSMTASLNSMTSDANGVLSTDYSKPANPAAYPLTMPVYAMLPTCGLSPAKITAATTFMQTAVSAAGQTNGALAGQLPDGYLPLTAAQRQQSQAAISALSSAPCPTAVTSAAPVEQSSQTPFAGTNGPVSGGTTPGTQVAGIEVARAASISAISSRGAGLGQIVLPLLLGLGGLSLIGAAPVVLLSSSGRAQVAKQFWRRVIRRG